MTKNRKINKHETKKLTLSLVMMVKNEKERIHVTLNSVLDSGNPIIDCMVIYDTGSTDNTIEIITNFCKKYDIPVYLKIGEFVNFCVSRNIALDFADNKADWNLLLDCNDEIKNGRALRNFIQNYDITPDENGKIVTALHVKQVWKNICSLDEYYNMRLFLTKYGWRYKAVVHEYLDTDNTITLKKVVHVPEFYIYQDRTQDDDKSSKRYCRDKLLLYNDHISNPDNTRTLFYLAQTYSCLNQFDKAYEYSLLRCQYDDFLEEKFHSYYRCGEYSRRMNHSWEESFSWYLTAFQFSVNISKHLRIEPLIRIVEYYRDKNWKFGYFFLKIAMTLQYPSDCVLFADRNMYEYERYHLHGIYVYYVGDIDAHFGLKSAETAYDKKKIKVDLNNANIYKSIIKSKEKITHKQTFFDIEDKENGESYDKLKIKADESYDKIKKKLAKIDSFHKVVEQQQLYLNKKKEKNVLDEDFNASNTAFQKNVTIYKLNIDKLFKYWKVTFVWYLKLYERSIREFDVANIYPLLVISEFYMNRNIWQMAFIFIQEACNLCVPKNYQKNIVMKYQYDYLRWHMFSLCANNIGKVNIALKACERAILGKNDSEIDRKNLIIFKKFLKK